MEKPHPIQQAFIDEQAVQCGFCLSGVVLTAKAFLDRNPKALDDEIRKAMENVYCRCNTAVRMMAAIKKYAEKGVRG
jgi:nicotinate dehydrogenase subunit A